MAKEIEIKLRVAEREIPALRILLDAMAQARGLRFLHNTYFDTDNAALAQAGAALRVRERDGRFEQTLKTAGENQAGMQVRGEWNWPIPSAHLEADPLTLPEVQKHWPQGLAVSDLRPVFTTHFERQVWLWQQGDNQVEIALDQGKVTAAGQEQPLCELELELLDGDSAALWELLAQLGCHCALWLSPVSKAERGYHLAGISVNWGQSGTALTQALAQCQRVLERNIWDTHQQLADNRALAQSFNALAEQIYLEQKNAAK